ncbi:MAG: hypothetical protein ACI88H_002383 [Cocleimonas sp.]|jgi:hypothetical protein
MFAKLIVVFLLLFSFSINADVIKWVDSEGKTHYSNKAPKINRNTSQKIKFGKYKKSEQNEEAIAPVIDRNEDVTKSDILYQPEVSKKKRKRKTRKVKKPSIIELRAQCDIAREKRLAPGLADAIKACIKKNESQTKKVIAYCERFNRTFGDELVGGFYRNPHRHGRYPYIAGGRSQRLFHNIPECLRLYRAEDKRSRLSRGYTD